MNYRIQIISLTPNSASTRKLLDDLRTQGVEASVFAAVDGRQGVPELEPGEQLDQQLSLKKRFVPLTNTEIACYLSHFRAIKHAFAEGVDALCLLEDDVRIESNFGNVLNELFALDQRHQFIRLMGLKRHKYKLLKVLDADTNLIRPVKGLCGTQGYVINRQGMKLVLDKGKHIHEPIDKFYDHFWETGLRCYGVVKHIIWEEATPSKIAKQSRKQAARSFFAKLKFHWFKLARSIHRQFYLLRHWWEFRPAQAPIKKPGRTDRIH